jgi:hypothetical protein
MCDSHKGLWYRGTGNVDIGIVLCWTSSRWQWATVGTGAHEHTNRN